MTVPTANPASTVVVLRDRGSEAPPGFEILMVRRHERTAFFGGAWVFPGGRLEPSDATLPDTTAWPEELVEAASSLPGLSGSEAFPFYVAAVRELFEEAGILLARDRAGRFILTTNPTLRTQLDELRAAVHRGERTFWSVLDRQKLKPALDVLVPLAHWVTPEMESRRFDARFFVTRMPAGQAASTDAVETTHCFWISATEALGRFRREEIVLPPPTWCTLKELAVWQSANEVLTWARGRTIVRIQPRFIQQDGVSLLLLPGDPLYPGGTGPQLWEATRFVLEKGRWNPQRA